MAAASICHLMEVHDKDAEEVELRRSEVMDLCDGELIVLKWRELQRPGDFTPTNLHLKRQSSPQA
ncbi:hypothetical protein [Bradyrhizobium sp. UNPF46]|uniref:hypothetical protein n=1 Tax=Bradyrhizobium sp. UNPF46 TaxID=1141168 RepID=UPI001FEE93FC|nr:hypothetical protein [Bradyrhizobium sp. UNPF46]